MYQYTVASFIDSDRGDGTLEFEGMLVTVLDWGQTAVTNHDRDCGFVSNVNDREDSQLKVYGFEGMVY